MDKVHNTTGNAYEADMKVDTVGEHAAPESDAIGEQ